MPWWNALIWKTGIGQTLTLESLVGNPHQFEKNVAYRSDTVALTHHKIFKWGLFQTEFHKDGMMKRVTCKQADFNTALEWELFQTVIRRDSYWLTIFPFFNFFSVYLSHYSTAHCRHFTAQFQPRKWNFWDQDTFLLFFFNWQLM